MLANSSIQPATPHCNELPHFARYHLLDFCQHSRYLRKADLNIRADPNSHSTNIGKYPKGTCIVVVCRIRGEVVSGNRTGVDRILCVPDRNTPTGPSNKGAAIVAKAKSQLGVPYSWTGGDCNGLTYGTGSGAHTNGFDCSGLTLYAVCQVTGIKLPHYTGDQYTLSGCQHLPFASKQPGDLIFYNDHVTIYMGNGQMIEALHTGAVVRISPVHPGAFSKVTTCW
ncbi:hypothetical protein BC938DRAFT_480222 [Jimgerdemannia flammicorona]|uniref:NlpC/P60 domain-containing protein n=1 Tax=Jimgerdemannia flammicorona TaxID=994334 RepID=A0A433QJ25_9FUNG|nr:hypothetical protein BC938DRAFT_480222 [Jimgerdemannia flammicorona]